MGRRARTPDHESLPGKENATEELPQLRHKTAAGRIACRIGVSVLSLIFLLSGCGILYVHGLLKRIDRTEFTGTSSLAVASDMPVFSGIDWAASTDSSGNPVNASSGITVQQNEQNLDRAHGGYSDVQKIDVLNDPDIQNILLIGADLSGLGDTTMIVSINRRTQKIHITSLMRAMYVKIPDRQWFMFNHAYGWGGPKLAVQTIENNFRIHIDDYVIVNFKTFPKVIDLLDGVDLNLTSSEAAYLSNDIYCSGTFQAGAAHLDGNQALAYARMRKSDYEDTDFKRTSRQRNVVQALIKKATGTGLDTLNQLAVNILPLIKTSLSDGELLSLAASAPSLIHYPISQKMLPVENDTTTSQVNSFQGIMYVRYPGASYSVEVYQVNFVKNVQAAQEFIRS